MFKSVLKGCISFIVNGKMDYRMKQVLGIKYKNNDFSNNYNLWLKEQVLNCPSITENTSLVVWNNLTRFAESLNIKDAPQKIETYKTTLGSRLHPPENTTIRYVHDEKFHNMASPNKIVDILYPVIKPKSVIDVGCGLGTFLKAFKEKSVPRVLGIDGDYVDRKKLFQYIEPDEFLVQDLEKQFNLEEKFDLVISLEVAEHLKEDSAEGFIESLVALGDVILFSAATPLTWYDDSHLNCQWPPYWRKLFNKHGFEMYDVIRHIFIHQDIFNWYKTNMFFVTKFNNTLVSKFEKEYPKSKYITRFTPIFYPQLDD